jgi:Dpy-30 motif
MDASYLQNNIGEALSEGLAQVVLDDPVDPVDYLGNWLLQYVENARNRVKVCACRPRRLLCLLSNSDRHISLSLSLSLSVSGMLTFFFHPSRYDLYYTTGYCTQERNRST